MKNSSALKLNNSSKTSFGREVNVSTLDARDRTFLLLDFVEEIDSVEWMREHKDLLHSLIIDHGVVYLRNAQIKKELLVETVCEFVPRESLADQYQGGVTGRPKIDRNLFLTTTIPPQAAILQHHEMSYLPTAPRKLFFYCNLPAAHGGATPVASARKAKKDLSPGLFKDLQKRGICYVRNYFSDASDSWVFLMSWQQSFNVKTNEEMNDVAAKLGFKLEWKANGQLRTMNRRPATAVHPITKEELMFNHTYLLHTHSEGGWVPPAMRGGPFSTCGPQEMEKINSLPKMDQPYLATWGDNGEVMSPSVLEELYQSYDANKISLNWRKGDLMILDNMLVSHGRDQYLGDRETFSLLSSY